jgi:hypothetical protein
MLAMNNFLFQDGADVVSYLSLANHKTFNTRKN